MFGVPASNRCGAFLKVLFSRATLTIISPPPCQGGIDVENFRATVERADPGRPTHFVSGEGEEIATDFLHIDRQMTGALRGIDQRERADRARLPAKIGHGIDRAERIGDMRESEQLHFRREQLIEADRARACRPHAPARNASRAPVRSARSCHGTRLLWCSISVSRITSPARRNFPPHALRDQIDALGRPARENDFVRARRAQICRHALPRSSRRPRSRASSARADRDAHWRCRARNNAGAHRCTARGFCVVAALSK